MRRAAAAALLLALVGCEAPPSHPSPPSPSVEAARRLFARAADETPLLDDVRGLCAFGGRITGSSSCEKAVDWAAARLGAAGLAVTLEPYSLAGLWLPEREEAAVLSSEPFDFPVAAAPGGPSTGGEIRAPLVDAGAGLPGDFARLGTRSRGAVALVRRGRVEAFGPDSPEEAARTEARAAAAHDAGAAALLLESRREGGVLERRPVRRDGAPAPLPVAVIRSADAARLSRLLAGGGVRVRLLLGCRTAESAGARNVVATLPGRTRSDEIVLLAAHLDSWDLGTGALDNAVNAALVIDVARGLKELDLTPARTVRFVLFTGEEQGMRGAAAYVDRHAPELDRHAAAVVFDLGCGRTRGFFLGGRPDLRPRVAKAFDGVPAAGFLFHLNQVYGGSDNLPFLLAGVPNLVAMQDLSGYEAVRHAETDVLARVDPPEARRNAGIAAVLVWALADSVEERPRRLSPKEVSRLVLRSGLADPTGSAARFSEPVAR